MTLVTDKSGQADSWAEIRYNLQYIPSCYYDGGETLLVGGYGGDLPTFAAPIIISGQREVPDIDFDVSMIWLGNYEIEVTVTVTNNHNNAPDQPLAPSGPQSGLLQDEHSFTAEISDPDGEDVYCMWDWGDAQTDWMGPYSSGQVLNVPHQWDMPGNKAVAIKVKDIWDVEGQWSEAASINVVERGDANSDFSINVADAVFVINMVFRSGPFSDPFYASDANCDFSNNVADAVFVINYVFKSGPPPGCR